METTSAVARETIQQLRTVDYKGRTDRGLKIVLDELLPCSCMSGAKQTEKTSRFGYCRKDDAKQKVLRCSGSKGMDYCSKEWQKTDYKLLCKATKSKWSGEELVQSAAIVVRTYWIDSFAGEWNTYLLVMTSMTSPVFTLVPN